MKEKQKHIDAFEEFYTLGGAASEENVRYLSGKCQVSERTIWRWYKSFGWKERVHLRNIDVNKEVEQKTNSTIADNKAKYLSYVHKLFDDWKTKVDEGEVPVEIKSVSDVDKVVKLGLLLQDEATDKTETRHKGSVDIDVKLPDDPKLRARGRDLIQQIRTGEVESGNTGDGGQQ